MPILSQRLKTLQDEFAEEEENTTLDVSGTTPPTLLKRMASVLDKAREEDRTLNAGEVTRWADLRFKLDTELRKRGHKGAHHLGLDVPGKGKSLDKGTTGGSVGEHMPYKED